MSVLSVAEQAKLIDKPGLLKVGDLRLRITIVDVKNAYGVTRFVVSDDYGTTTTVDAVRVQVLIVPEVAA